MSDNDYYESYAAILPTGVNLSNVTGYIKNLSKHLVYGKDLGEDFKRDFLGIINTFENITTEALMKESPFSFEKGPYLFVNEEDAACINSELMFCAYVFRRLGILSACIEGRYCYTKNKEIDDLLEKNIEEKLEYLTSIDCKFLLVRNEYYALIKNFKLCQDIYSYYEMSFSCISLQFLVLSKLFSELAIAVSGNIEIRDNCIISCIRQMIETKNEQELYRL